MSSLSDFWILGQIEKYINKYNYNTHTVAYSSQAITVAHSDKYSAFERSEILRFFNVKNKGLVLTQARLACITLHDSLLLTVDICCRSVLVLKDNQKIIMCLFFPNGKLHTPLHSI